jgi:hypothetical protein
LSVIIAYYDNHTNMSSLCSVCSADWVSPYIKKQMEQLASNLLELLTAVHFFLSVNILICGLIGADNIDNDSHNVLNLFYAFIIIGAINFATLIPRVLVLHRNFIIGKNSIIDTDSTDDTQSNSPTGWLYWLACCYEICIMIAYLVWAIYCYNYFSDNQINTPIEIIIITEGIIVMSVYVLGIVPLVIYFGRILLKQIKRMNPFADTSDVQTNVADRQIALDINNPIDMESKTQTSEPVKWHRSPISHSSVPTQSSDGIANVQYTDGFPIV